jgi:hypothetical protein
MPECSETWRSQPDSNRRQRRERARSWATRRWERWFSVFRALHPSFFLGAPEGGKQKARCVFGARGKKEGLGFFSAAPASRLARGRRSAQVSREGVRILAAPIGKPTLRRERGRGTLSGAKQTPPTARARPDRRGPAGRQRWRRGRSFQSPFQKKRCRWASTRSILGKLKRPVNNFFHFFARNGKNLILAISSKREPKARRRSAASRPIRAGVARVQARASFRTQTIGPSPRWPLCATPRARTRGG